MNDTSSQDKNASTVTAAIPGKILPQGARLLDVQEVAMKRANTASLTGQELELGCSKLRVIPSCLPLADHSKTLQDPNLRQNMPQVPNLLFASAACIHAHI